LIDANNNPVSMNDPSGLYAAKGHIKNNYSSGGGDSFGDGSYTDGSAGPSGNSSSNGAFWSNVVGALLEGGSGSSWTSNEDGTGTYNFANADVGNETNNLSVANQFPVYGADGNLLGVVNVEIYESIDLPRNGVSLPGVGISLSFDNLGNDIKNLNWIQSYMDTNEPPSTGLISGVWYNDPQPPDDSPYYYTMGEIAGHTIPEGVDFSDAPRQNYNGTSLFTLSLVQMGPDGSPSNYLMTFNYGYIWTNRQVSVQPLSPYW
jgi:hypothetical protein